MSSKGHAGTDPRRPDAVQKFDKKYISVSDSTADTFQLFSFLLGLGGLLFRKNYVAWAAVLCSFISWINTAHATADYKHMISAATISVMSVVSCYIVPVRPPAAQA